jgi:hypothetical protein
MWKRFWRQWTIDKPAALGDWLWDVLVVDLAAFLDRLTLRQVIAFIPILILVVAYAHSIPIPPELMLLGDVLAYIDIFSMILLLSLIGRAAPIFYVVRRAVEQLLRLLNQARIGQDRPDARHQRESGARHRRRSIVRTKNDDADVPIHGMGLGLTASMLARPP